MLVLSIPNENVSVKIGEKPGTQIQGRDSIRKSTKKSVYRISNLTSFRWRSVLEGYSERLTYWLTESIRSSIDNLALPGLMGPVERLARFG